MGSTMKEFIMALALVFLAVTVFSALGGCATIKYVPVMRKGDLPHIDPSLVKKAARPKKRAPANTPLLKAGKQWARDRQGWGDEADRSDVKSKFICDLHGGTFKDKTVRRNCAELNRSALK